MTVKELIKILETYDGDLNIDCNNTNGTYTDIQCLTVQNWTDREGYYHRTLTIMHSVYNQSASIVKGEDED